MDAKLDEEKNEMDEVFSSHQSRQSPEILASDYLDLARSYEARVLVKKLSEIFFSEYQCCEKRAKSHMHM